MLITSLGPEHPPVRDAASSSVPGPRARSRPHAGLKPQLSWIRSLDARYIPDARCAGLAGAVSVGADGRARRSAFLYGLIETDIW